MTTSKNYRFIKEFGSITELSQYQSTLPHHTLDYSIKFKCRWCKNCDDHMMTTKYSTCDDSNCNKNKKVKCFVKYKVIECLLRKKILFYQQNRHKFKITQQQKNHYVNDGVDELLKEITISNCMSKALKTHIINHAKSLKKSTKKSIRIAKFDDAIQATIIPTNSTKTMPKKIKFKDHGDILLRKRKFKT